MTLKHSPSPSAGPENSAPPHTIPPPTIPITGAGIMAAGVGNGTAGANQVVSAQEQQQALDLTSYVYNAGFVHAAWADTFLNVSPHAPLRLHALFASRSPLLYRYLSSYSSQGQGPPYHINITCDDPHLTHASLSMAIAMIYGHCVDLRTCDLNLAKGLLAAGSLLGLEHVSAAGYSVILNSLSKETILEILGFALSPQRPSPIAIATPSIPAHEELTCEHLGPYPPTTEPLIGIIIDFIFGNFVVSKPLDGVFEALLLMLPFSIYKTICESDKLVVRTAMERHNFAREVTGLREQQRKLSASPSGLEENVVLAFGGGKHGIEIIQKPLGKKKTLWKAGQ